MYRLSSHVIAVIAILTAVPLIAAERTGKSIYIEMCANCHGEQGEGVITEYPNPLGGDRTLAQLTRMIDRTMPQDAPDRLDEEGARLVAQYTYEEWYSPIAQARRAQPRIELARLTVSQYRNTLTDLVGGFGPQGWWGDERGLKAEYFKDRRFNKDDRKIERVDPRVDFDFGEGGPDGNAEMAESFSIRWQGSLFATETGVYDFFVKSDNGFRLWLNDEQKPLIDGWVRSGNDERKESLYLLGGRAYRLRLEMFKSKEGKEKKGSMSLAWQPPGGVREIIPRHSLSTSWFPEVYVCTTAFPPDDRSMGFERGSTVAKAWQEAVSDGALQTADYIVQKLPRLAGVKPEAGDRKDKLRALCGKFVERAFRRPLSEAETTHYIEQPFTGDNLDLAVKQVVLRTLTSPRFLYRELPGDNAPAELAYRTASRMSYILWDTMPTEEVWKAVREGKFNDPAKAREQAWSMINHPRARPKVRAFFRHWLNLEHIPEIAKDHGQFPGFDAVAIADLERSLELYVEDCFWNEGSDFRRLMTADSVWLNGRLAKLYGAELPSDADFQKVSLDAGDRHGLITQPYLLTALAYTGTTSPIHRGVFLLRGMLGRVLRVPPVAIAPTAPDLHPDLTTRERVELQTKASFCQSCHTMINPLGFTLEGYDAIGRKRAEEKGKPINSLGSYQTKAGDDQQFTGAKDLAEFLATSDEAQVAFADQMFHFYVKQSLKAHGAETIAALRSEFGGERRNMQRLLVEIAVRAAMTEPALEVARGE